MTLRRLWILFCAAGLALLAYAAWVDVPLGRQDYTGGTVWTR